MMKYITVLIIIIIISISIIISRDGSSIFNLIIKRQLEYITVLNYNSTVK